ncbi:MAG TPA: PAS domain S-box protein [Alphaproteobacteria bacterium]|nr:PAS domain S-box protein [Alphaproteobacteria bacterium]
MVDKDQSRLDAVLDTVVDGIILIDARGNVLSFNPACEKLFGYAAAEVIGQNVKMLMPEPFRAEHDGYLDNYRRTGERKIIGIGREVTGRRKDGSTFPMDLSVGEARHNGETIFVGVIRDLTERKNYERAILDSAMRLRAVLDTAVDGVILIDARGNISMFNPACEKLFGYAADEVAGQNVKMLMPEPYQSEHDGYLANYRNTGERKIIGIGREVTGRRKDGSTFPMDLSVGECKIAGHSSFVGVVRDLTDRKKAEAQLVQAQKMEAVGQLSGGIAHDFNNLLTVILGNAEVLAESLKARPDLEALINSIMLAAERGGELTQRLLAFSRRQTLQPTNIDCSRLVQRMQQLLRRTLRENIAIRIEVEEGLWAAFADPGQLESAILNLSLNAQDAMPSGGSLTIATQNIRLDDGYQALNPEVPPGRYILIAVTDTGTGMPPEVKARVFEPFFTTKEVGKGSGLGLSMVYGFVKQSNGHVSIYSEPGLGTTIRLYLPAPSGAEKGDELPPESGATSLAGSETILVVEDDPFVRAYAVSSLRALGYTVVMAADGREALEQLATSAALDLLFTDVVMPNGINGWELAHEARNLRPALKVLLTSGYALETLEAHGHLHPGLAVLNKPYRRTLLAKRIREVLDGN